MTSRTTPRQLNQLSLLTSLGARTPVAPSARRRIEELGRWALSAGHVLPRPAAAVVLLAESEERIDARLVDELLERAVPSWCLHHGVALPNGLVEALWAIALAREASGEWMPAEREAVHDELRRRRARAHHPSARPPCATRPGQRLALVSG
jgi:hypothetical protein